MTTRLEELQTMITDKIDILEERCYLLGEEALTTIEHRNDMFELGELVRDAVEEIMKMPPDERVRYLECMGRTNLQ